MTFRYSKNQLNSISNNVIRQIIECKGSLWIATDNGINRLDKRTSVRITRYYLRTDNKVPNQEKSYFRERVRQGDIICLIKAWDSLSTMILKMSLIRLTQTLQVI